MGSASPSRQRPPRPLLVALTGGIASGKTAVSDRLAALGAAVIDTDLVARELVEPGRPALEQIAETFGQQLIDENGGLDRRALRDIVFNDKQARQRLEGILHPRIEARVRELIDKSHDTAYILLVVPLLIETGLFGDADHVVVVDTPESAQIERLSRRDGIDEQQARNMLKAQATREQRLARADHVIDNSGSLEQLMEQADGLHQKLLRSA